MKIGFVPQPKDLSTSLSGTRKAILLPPLEDAISRFLRLQQQAVAEDLSGQAARVAHG
jgi:hypothetical protein